MTDGPDQSDPAQRGPDQVHTGQVGPAQSGPGQRAPGQAGSGPDPTLAAPGPTAAPPGAGDPRVEDALSRLAELDALPLADQVEVFTDIHRRLAGVLADPDSQA